MDCDLAVGFGTGCSASSLGIGTFFTCKNANGNKSLNLEHNKMRINMRCIVLYEHNSIPSSDTGD